MYSKKILILSTLITLSLTQITFASIKDKILEGRKQKNEISKDISKKNDEIESKIARINKEGKSIDQIIEKMAPIEAEYLKADQTAEEVRSLLKNRIRSLYLKGETNILFQLFNSNGLEEFLWAYDSFKFIIDSDQRLYAEYKTLSKIASEKKQKYDEAIAEIQDKIEALRKDQQSLEEEIKKSYLNLDDISQFEKSHKDDIIEINLAELRSGRLNFPFKGKFKPPVPGAVISSHYGYRGSPRPEFHKGTDFAAPVGTPILSPADGVVVEVKPSRGYGMLVTIYHGNISGERVYTRYAHSFSNQIKVRVGQQVYVGDHITSIGLNGDTTGPHLHWEVKVGSGDNPPFQNPMKWLNK